MYTTPAKINDGFYRLKVASKFMFNIVFVSIFRLGLRSMKKTFFSNLIHNEIQVKIWI